MPPLQLITSQSWRYTNGIILIYGTFKTRFLDNTQLSEQTENWTSFCIVTRSVQWAKCARSHTMCRAKAVNLIKLAAGIECRCHVQINEQYGREKANACSEKDHNADTWSHHKAKRMQCNSNTAKMKCNCLYALAYCNIKHTAGI